MKKIISVPYIDQTKRWPTGCESVSSVMLLNYLEIGISADEFIGTYLEKGSFYEIEGKTFGPDPKLYFAGSPYDSNSFGCYAPVIVRALNKVFESEGRNLRAEDVSGVSLENLQKIYIEKDFPVVFWCCIDLKPMVMGPSWFLADGKEFVWRSNEHCMLWVGYDDEKYYFNDPWMNHGTIGYDKKIIEERHREQYDMAVAVTQKS